MAYYNYSITWHTTTCYKYSITWHTITYIMPLLSLKGLANCALEAIHNNYALHKGMQLHV